MVPAWFTVCFHVTVCLVYSHDSRAHESQPDSGQLYGLYYPLLLLPWYKGLCTPAIHAYTTTRSNGLPNGTQHDKRCETQGQEDTEGCTSSSSRAYAVSGTVLLEHFLRPRRPASAFPLTFSLCRRSNHRRRAGSLPSEVVRVDHQTARPNTQQHCVHLRRDGAMRRTNL